VTDTRTLRRLGAGLVPVILLLALLGAGSRTGADPQAVRATSLRLPDITVERIDGVEVALGSLAGQVVVLNFWATWCDPCREEEPALREVWRRFGDRDDVVMLGLVYHDSLETAARYAREAPLPWPVAADPGSSTAVALGVVGIPEPLVVARDGQVVHHVIGPATERDLVPAIRRALEGPS
jgi:cytochrome c biogenesis protein CcmG, thiol:disulfide interchange protein DsbE